MGHWRRLYAVGRGGERPYFRNKNLNTIGIIMIYSQQIILKNTQLYFIFAQIVLITGVHNALMSLNGSKKPAPVLSCRVHPELNVT